MKTLENMEEGDYVRWDSKDWEVTDRTLYRESGDYSEVQWELTPHSGPTHYLIRSRENKLGGVEEIWVCTRQVKIRGVEYLASDGTWHSFEPQYSLKDAPAQARYDGLDLRLDGETQGTAEDDEGDTVTKLTWDYYDTGRGRNIAIEVWKEPDADYYEAYDGRVVSPSDFTLLARPAGAGRRRGNKGGLLPVLAVAAVLSFFAIPVVGPILNLSDAGAEYLLAFLLPAVCVASSTARGTHKGLLFVSLAVAAAFALLLMKFRGFGASYWEYALYGVLIGPGITETMGRLFPDIRTSDKAPAAGNATLLLLFIIGFAHYVKFAPRPHNSSGLFAACVLPLVPAAAVYFFYLYREGSDVQPQA